MLNRILVNDAFQQLIPLPSKHSICHLHRFLLLLLCPVTFIGLALVNHGPKVVPYHFVLASSATAKDTRRNWDGELSTFHGDFLSYYVKRQERLHIHTQAMRAARARTTEKGDLHALFN